MNKIYSLLLVFLFAVIASSNCYSQNNAYVTDLDLALQLSKETKQNIVIIFSADWCGACKNLKNDLPTIAGFDNKLICILDVDEERKLARQFKIKNLPTSIILDSDGDEQSRLIGYEKDKYQEWLKSHK
jgi:thioredoxin-like negative regulator of GroEL